ncbi:hypothetical protein ISF_04402 [Cordyceps fumosorosea ARSEF 2679]|uniref:Restriction of telomere capping protein 4 n=1 Tax=Cordyceps fumosorosea (strain ARSEF 2679) TaxID=1081104 RepID=A0A162J7S0_CORFA|nr:hypothetical protein ISF_04402 [Cordyceps fumosorosea ARSEF 2679]OAA64992.1 hypothetical protein ISF_04402 [Cordyceps fumosorosea ARSEF 2679]
MSRRLGLTANAPGLLKTVGNRPRKTPTEPIDDDAPPLSTDDEDEDAFSEGTVQAASASDRAASFKRKAPPSRFRRPLPPLPDRDIDTSSDERARRAAIKPTTFGSKKQPDAEAVKKRRRVSKSPEPERPPVEERLKPGSHLMDKYGFIGKRPARSTYGKSRSSQSSQPGSSQGSSKGAKTLRVRSPIESPQKRKKGSKFIVPDKNFQSSPCGSPKKLLTKLHGDSESEGDDSILSFLKSTKATQKGKNGKTKTPGSSPPPPRAVFKLPENFLDRSPGREPRPATDGADDLSKLSSDEEEEAPAADEEGGDRPRLKIPATIPDSSPLSPPPPASAQCPWCGDEVERALLDDFAQGRRLDVRRQRRFCALHKRAAALHTWRDRGYPEIAWDALEPRFAAHAAHLQAVLDGARPSPYHDAYAASRRRTARGEEDNLNPGYYGPRGLVAMGDYLVAEFGDALKRRAVGDGGVIAGKGAAAFVQAVLVAELGVRLIMEDLGVDEEEARRVLEESKALGELVQPEV